MNLDAALAVMVIAGLGVLFFGPWQSFCTAYARQVAFEKRDAIFDIAHEGRLKFDSQEYRTIRKSLEQLIRFAHRASLTTFLLQSYVLSRRQVPKRSDLTRAIESIRDRQTREETRALVWRAQYAVLVMMLAKSPIGCPLAILVLFMRWMKAKLPSGVSSIAVPAAEKMQIEAEHFRQGNAVALALAA